MSVLYALRRSCSVYGKKDLLMSRLVVTIFIVKYKPRSYDSVYPIALGQILEVIENIKGVLG